MADNDIQIQKSASLQQIIDDHLVGLSGYDIADKYGLDTEKVKQILQDANDEGKFIPDGVTPSADFSDRPTPLAEGVNPETKVETTKK